MQLNIQDAEGLAAAIAGIGVAVAAHHPDQPVRHVLVEQMLPAGGIELLIGVKRHPVLGLALIFGLGGSQVEVLRQFTTLLLPATRTEILQAIEKVRPGFHPEALAALLKALEAIQKPGLRSFRPAR